MKIVVYDPKPALNEYLTIKYLDPLLAYGKDVGRDITLIDSLDGIKDSAVLAESRHFTPQIIDQLKNNNNKVILFHINDSSYLGDILNLDPVDLIFKFSGIQQTRGSDEIKISDDFKYTKEPRQFITNDAEWDMYVKLRDSGRLISMPYAPFYHVDVDPIPYDQKKKKAVIRGGNHYLRYHLFLMLLKHNLINEDSAFTTNCYFLPAMDDHRRYCPDCQAAFKAHGKVSYDYYLKKQKWGCNNPFMDWQSEFEEGFFSNDQTHKWNNRCVPSFYRLTEEFVKYHGNVRWDLVENALNSNFLSDEDFYKIINQNLLYGDYKWMFSVDIPPRFWQGANARTINILPAWTKNQKEFPEVKEGDHYLSFEETFEGIEQLANVTKEQHDHITNNSFNLYNHWIKSEKYQASENLLNYIFENIERIDV